MKFSTNRYLFNFAKCITSALILLASASSSSAQFFPSFPQPATEQSGITSQGAFNIAQVPNSEYGTAVLAVFASHQGNNDLGYALMPDGVTAAWSDFNVDLPGVRCSNISTCAAGIAVYNGVIYIAYADFSGTGIDVVTATPVAGTSRYSWSLVHQDTSVNPTTAPGLAVVNGQLIIVFGASNDRSQSNAFYSISLNGTTWSQASE